jgi:hypothetical protein
MKFGFIMVRVKGLKTLYKLNNINKYKIYKI